MTKYITNQTRALTVLFLAIVFLSVAFVDILSSFKEDGCQSNLFHVQASFAFTTKLNYSYHINKSRALHVPRKINTRNSNDEESTSMLSMAKRSTEHLLSKQWLPSIDKSDDDIYASDVLREQLENESINYVAAIIRQRRDGYMYVDQSHNDGNENKNEREGDEISNVDRLDCHDDASVSDEGTAIKDLVKGKFRDLTCTVEGEKILEELFIKNPPSMMRSSSSTSTSQLSPICSNMNVLRGGIIAMQSLLIMGMQVGVKGSQEQQQRLVQHLQQRNDYQVSSSSQQQFTLEKYFDTLTSRQLKHQVDTTAGTQVLSALKRKRSAQSSYDLLVQLGVWEKHEDIALLRSGFPLRFTSEEMDAAFDAENGVDEGMKSSDPDELLGLRKDLRSLKVYTIDSEYASEIDDGLSIEVVQKKDGTTRHRVWIHIADADKWGKSSLSNLGKLFVRDTDSPMCSYVMKLLEIQKYFRLHKAVLRLFTLLLVQYPCFLPI